MRLIGHISSEPGAKLFGDYLLVSGIQNTVEEDAPSGWGIWIAEEDKIDTAKKLLVEFHEKPEAPHFQDNARGASALRASQVQEHVQWEKKVKGRRTLFQKTLISSFGPLTVGLIVVSVVVYIISNIPDMSTSWVGWLFITDSGLLSPAGGSLSEVRQGQIWRLVTPIFVHLTFLHILFNMLWLKDLGSIIEARVGTLYFGILVLSFAVGSNLAQFYIGGSGRFGGMSGVVYGLLAYVWIRGKLDPASGFFLHPTTMIVMMIWFGAAFAGVLGNVANWAHAGGLLIGLALGYVDASKGR